MKELIKNRRKELGITLEEIGDYVGVSKTTVQRWESGNISNMRRDRIKKLSEILQLEAEELLGITPQTENVFARVPVLGCVAAGLPITAQEDILGYEEVPKEWVTDNNIFALKIKGDSMEPRMVEGDIVIVRCQCDVENGETAIVMIDGEATCKKVIKHSDGIVLMANNSKYSPVYISCDDIENKAVSVLGKVIELRAKF